MNTQMDVSSDGGILLSGSLKLTESEFQTLRQEWEATLGKATLSFPKQLLGLFLRGCEMVACRVNHRPAKSLDETLSETESPGRDELKASLVRSLFIASLEGFAQPQPPGAFSLVMAILRLSFNWGSYASTALQKSVPIGEVSRVRLGERADLREPILAFVRRLLDRREFLATHGVFRGIASVVVGTAMAAWYAAALAVEAHRQEVQVEDVTAGVAIVERLFYGSPSALEKLFRNQTFGGMFEALASHRTVVYSLVSMI